MWAKFQNTRRSFFVNKCHWRVELFRVFPDSAPDHRKRDWLTENAPTPIATQYYCLPAELTRLVRCPEKTTPFNWVNTISERSCQLHAHNWTDGIQYWPNILKHLEDVCPQKRPHLKTKANKPISQPPYTYCAFGIEIYSWSFGASILGKLFPSEIRTKRLTFGMPLSWMKCAFEAPGGGRPLAPSIIALDRRELFTHGEPEFFKVFWSRNWPMTAHANRHLSSLLLTMGLT